MNGAFGVYGAMCYEGCGRLLIVRRGELPVCRECAAREWPPFERLVDLR